MEIINKEKFLTAEPWPHMVIDDFIKDTELLDDAIANIPDPTSVDTADLGKLSTYQNNVLNEWGERSAIFPIRKLHPSIQAIFELMYSEELLKVLDEISGYKIVRGLDNVLCSDGSLNKEDCGGYLELYDRKCDRIVKSISPKYNRFVLTWNDETTYHAVSNVTGLRKSFCVFYYTKDKLAETHPFLFYHSQDVSHAASVIKKSNVSHEAKWFASLVFCQSAKFRYPDFDMGVFNKLCGL